MRSLLLIAALTIPLALVGCQSGDDLASLGDSEPLSNYNTLVSGLSTEESTVRAESSEGISRFDTDGDGVLSAEEFQVAQDTMRLEFVSRYDTDGDGILSEEEREAAHEAVREEFEARYDTDGDGEISPEEREQIRRHHPGYGGRLGRHGADDDARRQAFLDQFDSDGDGTLSEEEREAMAESMPEPPPHGPRPGGRQGGPGWW